MMRNKQIARCVATAARGLLPPESTGIAAWAETHRIITTGRKRGRYEIWYTPYAARIYEWLSPHSHTVQVSMMFGAQLGKSTVMENFILHSIAVDPCPMMYVAPSDTDVDEAMRERFDPAIEADDDLREKVDRAHDKHGINKTGVKRFRGGMLYGRGTGSSAKYRAKSIRKIALDEVDAYKKINKKDGSIVQQFVGRTTAFGDRAKILISSTPTTIEESEIYQVILESDAHKLWVPCPHCGASQILSFWHLKWEKGHPEKAEYYCPACGCHIEEHAKTDIMPQGRWLPWLEREEERRAALADIEVDWQRDILPAEVYYNEKIILHPAWLRRANKTGGRKIAVLLDSMYAPYGSYSWPDMAMQYVAAIGDPERLQAWTNIRLAEPWRGMPGDAVEERSLRVCCMPYSRTVPEPVAILTGAVDQQADRLEILIAGWDKYKAPWHIMHDVIYGDLEDSKTWQQLDDYLLTRYDGMPLAASCVDTGGVGKKYTSEAYAYCRARYKQNVFAIKGHDSAGHPEPIWPVWHSKVGKNKNVPLFKVGVHKAKLLLFDRMKIAAGDPGAFHFPDAWDADYRDEYLAQLCSEKIIPLRRGGAIITEFIKMRPRNEILDLWTYSYAALVAWQMMFKGDIHRAAEARAAALAATKHTGSNQRRLQRDSSDEKAWIPERDYFGGNE